jgi:Tic22 family protein import component
VARRHLKNKIFVKIKSIFLLSLLFEATATMKSLLRIGATLGLIGTTALSTWLGTTLQALALPTEEVVKILQGVPVFTIVDAQGAPLVAVGNDKEKVTGVFISQQEANGFLQELKKQKPDVGSQVSVQPVSLGEVVKIAQANAKQPEPLGFAYVPIPSEVQAAQKIPNSEYQGGVPLFVARGGQDQGYLTIQQGNEQIIPFFLEASQIQQMVEQFKKEQPSMANSIVIDVVAMENVISTLQTSDDAMLKQIRIVPTQEAIQFIRSLSAQQPQ